MLNYSDAKQLLKVCAFSGGYLKRFHSSTLFSVVHSTADHIVEDFPQIKLKRCIILNVETGEHNAMFFDNKLAFSENTPSS